MAATLGDCDLDQIAFKRASIIGVTFPTRSPAEAIACSQRFAEGLPAGFRRWPAPARARQGLPFDRIAEAHDYMRSNAQVGKIVLTMDQRIAAGRGGYVSWPT